MNQMRRLNAVLLLFPFAVANAQTADPLRALSDSVEALSHRVNRAVVQVFSTGYSLGGEEQEGGPTTAGLITKQRSSGSGVVVSADGYIVNNNHVVQNARHVGCWACSRF